MVYSKIEKFYEEIDNRTRTEKAYDKGYCDALEELYLEVKEKGSITSKELKEYAKKHMPLV